MTTNNHPAHGPVSLDRLHQISEILSKAASQSDGGNLGYAMADAMKVITGVIARELVRREHAAWSQATFGDVGPIGPLKHLSKEALEAAAIPSDPLEWADMQFLLWDAQRRAGISDEQITQAMVEKLAVNKQREWPEPKDGEPRQHIKEQPAPVMPAELHPDTQNLVADFCTALAEKLYGAQLKYGYDADWKQDGWATQCLSHFHQHIAKGDPRDVAAYCAFMWYHGWKTEPVSGPVVPEEIEPDSNNTYDYVDGWSACRAAMLQGGEPVSNHDELALYYLQGQKDGLEWAAQLAEANHPLTGDWLYDDPLELAKAIRKGPDMPGFAGSSPVTQDGWISCSERMPDSKTGVLVAREFGRKGDWRMKWATYIPWHPDTNDGWLIPGASWKPSHWMPLPESPQEEK
ncbi:DUF550 domain-containing protein [Salmonella enterica subsp. enterica serovar Norwich]|nr:DUF550 domain-containing protein [Salmonella enterica subsp. enterica serovar Norwich]